MIKSLIVSIDYWIKNKIISILKHLLFSKTSNFKKGNIIIFRTGSIGDSICAFPSIYAIRAKYPDSNISLLTNPAGKNVSMEYLLDPNLNISIVNYLGLGFIQLFKLLKSGNYDLFIELPQTHATFITNVRNLLTAKAIGAKFGFGWQVYSTSYFKKHQEIHNHFLPETERLLSILAKEGIYGTPDKFPIAFMPENKIKVMQFLSENGITDKSKNIAIVAGAKRSTNRWPINNYAETINQLTNLGYQILLIGGKDDIAQNQPLVLLKNVFDAVGKFTPIESALLMEECCLVISNDTGPLHLSYAVGTPLIGIYSSRDYPKHWFPPSTSTHKIFRNDKIACSICLLEECPNQIVCLEGIKPKEVYKSALELLENRSN